MVVGTRGDLEPFLAIGERLKAEGHELVFCAPAQLQSLVSDGGFIPLSPAFLEMLDSPQGRALMSGKLSVFAKIWAGFAIARVGVKVDRELSEQQYQALERSQPDMVICHPKCTPPLPWTMRRGRKLTYLSPIPFYVHADERRPHTGINGNLGPYFNRLSYKLINLALAWSIRSSAKGRFQEFRMNPRRIARALQEAQFHYAISPALYPRNPRWPDNVQVVGFSSRALIGDSPDLHLRDFLKSNPRFLFLTFGSMISSDPEVTSRALYECIDELGIPVVVNTASGGLLKLEPYAHNRRFLFVETADYHLVLRQASGVIHHGGAGTTHLGLAHGCPTFVIPHVFDQFTWGALIEKLEVGPTPLAVNQLTKKVLQRRLADLLENPKYLENARRLADAISKETDSADSLIRREE